MILSGKRGIDSRKHSFRNELLLHGAMKTKEQRTLEIPTNYFRWTRIYGCRNRELEQKWIIQKIEDGVISEQTEVWREIEEVD